MILKDFKRRCRLPSRGRTAFTLIEVVMAVGLLGIMITSLYAGFAFAFTQIRLTQENVRATQIIEERMEVVRLLNWDQVANTPGYVPTSFSEEFYANNPTNTGSFFTGTVLVTNAPVAEAYSNSLRMIQIKVTWTSGNVLRTRQMTTFVSQYGMQNYVY